MKDVWGGGGGQRIWTCRKESKENLYLFQLIDKIMQ